MSAPQQVGIQHFVLSQWSYSMAPLNQNPNSRNWFSFFDFTHTHMSHQKLGSQMKRRKFEPSHAINISLCRRLFARIGESGVRLRGSHKPKSAVPLRSIVFILFRLYVNLLFRCFTQKSHFTTEQPHRLNTTELTIVTASVNSRSDPAVTTSYEVKKAKR